VDSHSHVRGVVEDGDVFFDCPFAHPAVWHVGYACRVVNVEFGGGVVVVDLALPPGMPLQIAVDVAVVVVEIPVMTVLVQLHKGGKQVGRRYRIPAVGGFEPRGARPGLVCDRVWRHPGSVIDASLEHYQGGGCYETVLVEFWWLGLRLLMTEP